MAVKYEKKWFCHFKRDTLSRTFFVPFIAFFDPFFTHVSAPRTTRTITKLLLGPLSIARGQKNNLNNKPFITSVSLMEIFGQNACLRTAVCMQSAAFYVQIIHYQTGLRVKNLGGGIIWWSVQLLGVTKKIRIK